MGAAANKAAKDADVAVKKAAATAAKPVKASAKETSAESEKMLREQAFIRKQAEFNDSQKKKEMKAFIRRQQEIKAEEMATTNTFAKSMSTEQSLLEKTELGSARDENAEVKAALSRAKAQFMAANKALEKAHQPIVVPEKQREILIQP